MPYQSCLITRLLELPLDFSPGSETFSDVGNGPSALADLQSGRRNSVYLEHELALLSMVENYRGLKPLTALFMS